LENIVAIYFGTTIQWYLGGEWSLDTDKKTETYGEAFIDFYDPVSKKGSYLFPFNWTWFIETDQFDENLGTIYERIINKQIREEENTPKYKISPKRTLY
ncbi:hypothetical protein, partial [uncultured Flavobacterium sp.]|uniref:hypothetical protein n=1 Tax=uncultured Flavobacterium sp. TaxID=165435 RepID=UPI0025E08F33